MTRPHACLPGGSVHDNIVNKVLTATHDTRELANQPRVDRLNGIVGLSDVKNKGKNLRFCKIFVEIPLRTLQYVNQGKPTRPSKVRESIMSKASVYATLLAVSLSYFAVSCAAPAGLKPGATIQDWFVAATSPPATQASATVAATPAVVPPGGGGFVAFAVVGFAALFASMFVLPMLLRGKAPETTPK